MKALYFDERLSLRDFETPHPQSHEALIQVIYAGICGTDRQILKGYSGFEGVAGHEFVGRVVECADGAWSGRRVVGEINVTCRACDWCRRGLGRHCPNRTVMGIVNRPGAFAEYLALPMTNVWAHDPGLPRDVQSIFDPLGNAVHTALSFDVLGEDVLITGAGPIGIMAVKVVRHAGARHDRQFRLAVFVRVRRLQDARSFQVRDRRHGDERPRVLRGGEFDGLEQAAR